MDIEQIVELFFNNGVGIAVIIYFMLRDFKFMDKMTTALSSLNATLTEVQDLTRELRKGVTHE